MNLRVLASRLCFLFVLAAFVAAANSCIAEDGDAAGGYEDLLALFADWREFEQPPLRDGAPETGIGQFNLSVNATYLDEYIERTSNPDGTVAVKDLTGGHTNEVFKRAFPEWRAMTSVDWNYDRWSANVDFRWVDDMITDSITGPDAQKLDSVMFTDLQVRHNPAFLDDALSVVIGFNNVFDEDPPLCDPCGSTNMSIVAHDLPGTIGYLRVTYQTN